MAFDHSLPRGHAHDIPLDASAGSGERTWTLPRTTAGVEDKLPGRTSRAYFTTHSVTLWDEIAPATDRQTSEPDDSDAPRED
jgi:hypothetical protein